MLLRTTRKAKIFFLSRYILLCSRINPAKFCDSSSSPNHQFQSIFHSAEPAIDSAPLSPPTLRVNSTHVSSFDFASLLQSCIARRAIEPGRQLHALLFLSGIGYDTNLATKLVNLYCACDCLSNARLLFDRIPKNNIFLWNVLIRGYAWNGPFEVAIGLFYRMLDYGIVPDNFTFPFVLKACSTLSVIDAGRDIHEHAIRTRWETDVFVGAALIDMYAKCGCVGDSRRVFDKIQVRDVVLWNSMLAAYSQNGCPEECLSLCGEMALTGMRPTVATLVTAISSAADIAALPQGRELHGFSWRRGFEIQDKQNIFKCECGKGNLGGLTPLTFCYLVNGTYPQKPTKWELRLLFATDHGSIDGTKGYETRLISSKLLATTTRLKHFITLHKRARLIGRTDSYLCTDMWRTDALDVVLGFWQH
ncbi:hypothetical protein U1Q18_006598 [Sarracenia purpurea var. burkii]